MNNFSNADFEEAIEELVPAYQRNFLLSALGDEKFDFDVAGLTLTGEYKSNSPVIQTSIIAKGDSMWGFVLNELYDFACTSSTKYKEERNEAGISLKNLISIIATSIAATYHLGLGVVTGVVTLAVMSMVKMSKNAWCAFRKSKKDRP